jgi:hypothetical protein
MGTPASIIAIEPPQTVAIDDEPVDSDISDTTLIVYGNSPLVGKALFKALHASLP